MSQLAPNDAFDLFQEDPPKAVADFLNEPYPLAADQIEFYQDNGYVKLEGLLTGPALDYFRAIIGAAVKHAHGDDQRPLAERSVYQQSFLQAMRLCFQFPAVKPFTFARRFANVARALMAVDAVRLWHDQALYKEPGGRITDHHQDAAYWPLEPGDKTITLWMALCDVPVERGAMAFVPKSHRLNIKHFVDIFAAEDEIELTEEIRQSRWETVPLAAGDATFHSGLTFHRAGANKTSEMREAMTIIYFADGSRYDYSIERLAQHNREEVGSLEKGDLINTAATPILAEAGSSD